MYGVGEAQGGMGARYCARQRTLPEETEPLPVQGSGVLSIRVVALGERFRSSGKTELRTKGSMKSRAKSVMGSIMILLVLVDYRINRERHEKRRPLQPIIIRDVKS